MFYFAVLFYLIILDGRLGNTDDFATIPFHLVKFSAAHVVAKSIPVYSLTLSSQLFLHLIFLLFPFTVACRIVYANPEDLDSQAHKSSRPHISQKILFDSFQTVIVIVHRRRKV